MKGWEKFSLERYVDHVKEYLNEHSLRVQMRKIPYDSKIEYKKVLTKKEAESILLSFIDQTNEKQS